MAHSPITASQKMPKPMCVKLPDLPPIRAITRFAAAAKVTKATTTATEARGTRLQRGSVSYESRIPLVLSGRPRVTRCRITVGVYLLLYTLGQQLL